MKFVLAVLGLGAPGSLRKGESREAERLPRLVRHVERLPTAEFFPDVNYSTPRDPLPREHVFVLGAETSGTRLVAKVLAGDLGMPDAKQWDGAFASSDREDVVFHVSLPWGSVCEEQSTEPTLSTWGANYHGLNAFVTAPDHHPGRFDVDIAKLLSTYEAAGERIEVVLVLRDPEVTLRGKMASRHCTDRTTAIDEQVKAFELLHNAPHVANVHMVCYEDLVVASEQALQPVRAALHINGSTKVDITDGNAKYLDLPDRYECTKMLAYYVQMCPDTPLAKQYAACSTLF